MSPLCLKLLLRFMVLGEIAVAMRFDSSGKPDAPCNAVISNSNVDSRAGPIYVQMMPDFKDAAKLMEVLPLRYPGGKAETGFEKLRKKFDKYSTIQIEFGKKHEWKSTSEEACWVWIFDGQPTLDTLSIDGGDYRTRQLSKGRHYVYYGKNLRLIGSEFYGVKPIETHGNLVSTQERQYYVKEFLERHGFKGIDDMKEGTEYKTGLPCPGRLIELRKKYAIHKAVKQNDQAMVKALIDEGASIRAKSCGQTPLDYAKHLQGINKDPTLFDAMIHMLTEIQFHSIGR